MTVASMTGFARAQGVEGPFSWVWEVKSVNGRGLEIRTRLPSGLDVLDMAVRDGLGKRLKRGNVNVNLTLDKQGQGPTVRVNEDLLAQLVDLAERLSAMAPNLAPPSIDGLLALRGVMEVVEAEEGTGGDEALVARRDQALLSSFAHCLEQLAEMRVAEGARLEQLLSAQITEIERLASLAEGTAALRPDAIRERFLGQIRSLLVAEPSLSEERLSQVLAMLATKADVREELDRLRAHVAAARDLIQAGGAVGRKLDFLCQEFNREANTLCSKSGDVELTRIGLDLKSVIEQFREQVQNLE